MAVLRRHRPSRSYIGATMFFCRRSAPCHCSAASRRVAPRTPTVDHCCRGLPPAPSPLTRCCRILPPFWSAYSATCVASSAREGNLWVAAAPCILGHSNESGSIIFFVETLHEMISVVCCVKSAPKGGVRPTSKEAEDLLLFCQFWSIELAG